jgi:hypothetical protein
MPGLKSSILLLLLTAPALGQAGGDTALQDLRPLDLRTTDLQPVDAFVADTTVLSTSLRAVQFSLQQSYNFEQLMQSDSLGGQYVRRAGGLWAVSPTSTYRPTRSGYVPTIAPGTVFHIGNLPVAPAVGERSYETQRHDPFIDAPAIDALAIDADRYQTRDTQGVPSQSPGPSPPIVAPDDMDKEGNVRFLLDEDYRRQVMLVLVWRATGDEEESDDQAARGPSSPDSK